VVDDDEVREGRLVRPNGRLVAWTEWGRADGVPLLRLPGIPGSRWMIRADRTPWRERDLRVITTERPGFGASTRLPGRGFAEHADDLRAILDHQGIETAFVKGGSGASPHILAFLAQHGGRARAATIEVGTAPMTPEEVAQMLEVNREAHALITAGDRSGLRALTLPVWEAMTADPIAGLQAVMAEAPEEDQQIMADPIWQATMARGIAEALAPGVEGWLDEDWALDHPWDDIDLSAITTSITWWHGDADRNCPLSAAQRLVGALPTATLHVRPGGGHLGSYRREPEILDELLARG
jgi:pimeloyl-ACP methyl ester carboxylesterase